MNAGKSTALLQAAHNYEERGMAVRLFTTALDDRDGSVEGGVEVQVIELGEPAQPIRIGVHEVRPAGHRRVHPGYHESR